MLLQKLRMYCLHVMPRKKKQQREKRNEQELQVHTR